MYAKHSNTFKYGQIFVINITVTSKVRNHLKVVMKMKGS